MRWKYLIYGHGGFKNSYLRDRVNTCIVIISRYRSKTVAYRVINNCFISVLTSAILEDRNGRVCAALRRWRLYVIILLVVHGLIICYYIIGPWTVFYMKIHIIRNWAVIYTYTRAYLPIHNTYMHRV